MNTFNYLLVDDDKVFLRTLKKMLLNDQQQVSTAENIEEALNLANQEKFDRAVIDLKIDKESGLQLIEPLLKLQPHIKIVMLTGYATIHTTVQAIKLGAFNYACKPINKQQLLNSFEIAAEQAEEKESLEENPTSLQQLEWEHINAVLTEHQGNISATARALGMHRRTLQRKLQKKP